MTKKIKVLFIEDDRAYIETHIDLLREVASLEGMERFQFDHTSLFHDREITRETASAEIDTWKKNPEMVPGLLFLDIILPTCSENKEKLQEEQEDFQYTTATTNGCKDTTAGILLYRIIRGLDKNNRVFPDHPKELTQLPIIILTANYRLAPSTRASMQGDKYLLWIDKPFIPEDVAGIVGNFLTETKQN